MPATLERSGRKRRRTTRADASDPLLHLESDAGDAVGIRVLTQVLALVEELLGEPSADREDAVRALDAVLKRYERKQSLGAGRHGENYTSRELVIASLVDVVADTIARFAAAGGSTDMLVATIAADIATAARIPVSAPLRTATSEALRKRLEVEPDAMRQPRTTAINLVAHVLDRSVERVTALCTLARRFPERFSQEVERRKRYWYNIDPNTGALEEPERLRRLLNSAIAMERDQFGVVFTAREQIVARIRLSNLNVVANDPDADADVRRTLEGCRTRGLGILEAISVVRAQEAYASTVRDDLMEIAVVKAAVDVYTAPAPEPQSEPQS